MARPKVPLAERANLSLSEAMRFARIGHGAAKERLASGRWLWFWEGRRKRIITSSPSAQPPNSGPPTISGPPKEPNAR